MRQEWKVGSKILLSGLGSVMETGSVAVYLGASDLMISLVLEPLLEVICGGSIPASEFSEPLRETEGEGVDEEDVGTQLGLGELTFASSSRTKLRMGFGITLGKLCWSGKKLIWPVE